MELSDPDVCDQSTPWPVQATETAPASRHRTLIHPPSGCGRVYGPPIITHPSLQETRRDEAHCSHQSSCSQYLLYYVGTAISARPPIQSPLPAVIVLCASPGVFLPDVGASGFGRGAPSPLHSTHRHHFTISSTRAPLMPMVHSGETQAPFSHSTSCPFWDLCPSMHYARVYQ